MIRELYNDRREKLENDLRACADAREAADCLGRVMEKMRLDLNPSLAIDARRESDRLFDAAEKAALLMMTVTETDVSVKSELRPQTRIEKIRSMLPWISAGIGALLTVWMMLIDQDGAALLSLASAVIGVLQGRRSAQTGNVRFETRTRVNVYEVMRLTDRLMAALDASFSQIEAEQAALPGEQPRLSGEWYAPVQMLMEAVYTRDGSYALKAAPQLIEALAGQGVEAVSYSEDRRDLFDLFPGTEGGLTIRPALVKDGHVLARGQATEQM